MLNFLLYLALGAVAGWLAGHIMRGGGFGLLWNIIIGIIGGFIGGWLMSLLHIQKGGLRLGAHRSRYWSRCSAVCCFSD